MCRVLDWHWPSFAAALLHDAAQPEGSAAAQRGQVWHASGLADHDVGGEGAQGTSAAHTSACFCWRSLQQSLNREYPTVSHRNIV